MKNTYRANDFLETEFDDPVDCQIYEKIFQFLATQDGDSDWQYLMPTPYEREEYTLKLLIEHRKLFKQLVDQIDKAEAEL